MPELVSDLFGAANENKKKQQLQQKPATADATAVGAGMSTLVWAVSNLSVHRVLLDRTVADQCEQTREGLKRKGSGFQ